MKTSQPTNDTSGTGKVLKNDPRALPWDPALVRSAMSRRRYSHADLADLLTERAGAGHHFSKSYVTKVLTGAIKPSPQFVDALRLELNLPAPSPEQSSVNGFVNAKLEQIEELAREIRETLSTTEEGQL